MHPLTYLDPPLEGKKLTMSEREDSRDSISGRQNVVEEVTASFPSLSDQLHEFTNKLIEAVDETVHKIEELKQKGMKVSSEGKVVCRELMVVINNSYNYTQAINDFTWNAKRGERQKHAFEEAAKEKNPNIGPMYEYIQDIQRHLGRAGEKYEKFRDSCKCVVERLGVVLEEIRNEADEEESKKTASQVTGGVLAGGAMAAGVGTGATIVVTGITLSLAAAVPTLGIGTIIGLVITGVAAPVVGIGTGAAAAVGTHFVAKHYSKKKMAFLNLHECIMNLERQAVQLNHVLDKIKISMNTFNELTQDAITAHAPLQRDSLLESMRLLFRRLEEFHSVCSKCCETLKEKSEVLEKANESCRDA